ncbi:MAG: cytochrome-c oxidase, cbb3-type subunit I [Bacteroidetes bacterium]|nr:cytochrome-c oxidase, cbb3-type subunit I [Bacteroidota bacterium]
MEIQTNTCEIPARNSLERFYYDNKTVRDFGIACVAWGVISLLVGVIIACQLFLPRFYPDFDLGLSFLTFGMLIAIHTKGAIFAFVGNMIFMGVYYSLQRLCKARMWSDTLSRIHFWGWQCIIALAVVTLALGYTTSKEYAELEWPIDILITIIWVVFGINFMGTVLTRRVKHLYVAIWFYIGTLVTIAVLHIVNSMELPVSWMKSYSVYAGVQDALVQWWYGHNAVAFFLTTPFLGLMYYFLPKVANRPVYSYRLSIIHFWSLIFLYIWAGPHHLLYTSLPDWAQSVGVVFSIMLIAPSWGGMINGLLTLRGAWDEVRTNPILKFMVVAITCYGMATFEGPMHSLKFVNALSHYTDWIPAHVHIGTLGWNGFMTFAILYYLIPKLYNTQLYSKSLANLHFWIGTLGMVFWTVAMYVSGVMQGLMLQDFNPDGTLKYANFLETTMQVLPMHIIRAIGGTMYLTGMVIMVYNLWKTAKQGSFVANEMDEAPAKERPENDAALTGYFRHRIVEGKPMIMLALATIVILIGGMVEFIPLFTIKSNIPTISSVKPYTPLELEGRNLYIREGCNACHSQMIRPFRSETERYGEYSKAGEFVYDHPFLWGSKRTGPDLHRIGGKYPHSWHFRHMRDPRSTSPGSIMPSYPWLISNKLDTRDTRASIVAMRRLGVPYPFGFENEAVDDLQAQALKISDELKKDKITIPEDREIIALIAYLQRLGTDIKGEQTSEITK